MKRYQGAKGLKSTVEEMVETGRNDRKYVVIHEETGLFLELENGTVSYVQGTRDDATGFNTMEEAKETATRLGLAGNGYKIRRAVR